MTGLFRCACGSEECFVEPALSPLLQWLAIVFPGRFPRRTVCARCLRRFPSRPVPNGAWHKRLCATPAARRQALRRFTPR
jgi:hypothetical protein